MVDVVGRVSGRSGGRSGGRVEDRLVGRRVRPVRAIRGGEGGTRVRAVGQEGGVDGRGGMDGFGARTGTGNSPDGAPAVRPEKLPPMPRRFVVADDDSLVLAGLEQRLRELGFEVVGTAANGEEARAVCEQLSPDMALLDQRMPREEGGSVARQVFAEFAIPSVICSAYSDAEDVEHANTAGVFGYVVKPAQAQQLRASILVAWRRYQEFISVNWEAAALRTRLAQRKYIEQAKWLIVRRDGCSENEALRMMQKTSRKERLGLIDVAHRVIAELGQESS